MFNVLNFKYFLITSFLSFVSVWVTESAWAQTSGQEKNEFSIFDEYEKTQGKSKTLSTPKNPAKGSAVPIASAPKEISKETSEQKIERLKNEIRKGPKNISLIVQLAEEFFNKREYEKATVLLWKHVDKMDRHGLILLVKAHEKQAEPSEMIRAMNILIGKDSKDAEAYSFLGNAYVLLRKNKDAVENYKKAIELNNKFEPAYDGLISMYEKRNPPNLYELRVLYQDMIEAIGTRAHYLRKLCEINTNDGTFEPAIQNCRDAINKEPKVADPFVYLAISYKSTGQDDLAAKTFKKAANDFPKSELAQYHYAKHLEDQKNFVEAMNAYKAGTEADPDAARSWLGLANCSFEIKKYELSLIAYNQACKHDKKTAVAFRRATTVLRNQKNSQWVGKFESASENCTF